MVHKTVLKVDICCAKCKKELLKTVCGLEGVNKVEVDQEKGTLTVIGEADPYDIIMRIRKGCKFARFESVGPPPKPDEKKPDPCECKGHLCLGCYLCRPSGCPGFSCSGCMVCKPVAYMTVDHMDPGPTCSIM